MKRMSRLPPTETDEATAATNVLLDLLDCDGEDDGDGDDNDGDSEDDDVDVVEPRKHGLGWTAQFEIDNIPSSIV
jgi:hypothetical protein